LFGECCTTRYPLWETGECASPPRSTSAARGAGSARWGGESHACCSSATSGVTRCPCLSPSPNTLPAAQARRAPARMHTPMGTCVPAQTRAPAQMRVRSHAAVGSRREGAGSPSPCCLGPLYWWSLPRQAPGQRELSWVGCSRGDSWSPGGSAGSGRCAWGGAGLAPVSLPSSPVWSGTAALRAWTPQGPANPEPGSPLVRSCCRSTDCCPQARRAPEQSAARGTRPPCEPVPGACAALTVASS